jgi:hypothetical protein
MESGSNQLLLRIDLSPTVTHPWQHFPDASYGLLDPVLLENEIHLLFLGQFFMRYNSTLASHPTDHPFSLEARGSPRQAESSQHVVQVFPAVIGTNYPTDSSVIVGR